MEVYCDLDGVFADFTEGANELHGKPRAVVNHWNWYEDWGISGNQFWAPIKEAGSLFYTKYVRPYRWVGELLDRLSKYGPLVIVTANPKHSGLMAGKLEWIDKYLGDCEVIYCNKKERLAKPHTILLDDYEKNLEAFKGAGGKAVTFPQPWNNGRNMRYDRIDYAISCIDYYVEKGAEYAII